MRERKIRSYLSSPHNAVRSHDPYHMERSVYFFARHDIRKLTCLTAKFQEEEPLREIG